MPVMSPVYRAGRALTMTFVTPARFSRPTSIKSSAMKAQEILKKAQLFTHLSGPEMLAVSSRAVVKRFEPGQTIFSEGEPCEGLHVIAQGKLRLFKTSASGREQV